MTAADLGTGAPQSRRQSWIDGPEFAEAASTFRNCRCWRTCWVDPFPASRTREALCRQRKGYGSTRRVCLKGSMSPCSHRGIMPTCGH